MLAGMLVFVQAGAGCTVFLVKISIHLALRKKLSVFFPLMTTMQTNTLPKTKVAPENGWQNSDNPFGVFPPRKSSEKILPQNDITPCVKLIRFIPGTVLIPLNGFTRKTVAGHRAAKLGRFFAWKKIPSISTHGSP